MIDFQVLVEPQDQSAFPLREGVVYPQTISAVFHQVRVFQLGQMPRNPPLWHLQNSHQLAYAELSFCKQKENAEPRLISKRLEYRQVSSHSVSLQNLYYYIRLYEYKDI